MTDELALDLKDTVNLGKKWLFNFNTGKSQLDLFDWSNKTGDIDVKMNRSVQDEKSCL